MSSIDEVLVAGASERRESPIVALLRSAHRDPLTFVAFAILALSLLAAILAPWLAPQSPTLAAPVDRMEPLWTAGHVLGTDQLGRDMLSRMLYGARLAWIVGTLSAAFALVFGGVLGALAGYFGGWLDGFISRSVDGVMAFPPVLLALIIAAILGPSTGTGIVALAVVFTPLMARVMRGEVLARRDLEYVAASRNLGKPEPLILLQDIVPNTMSAMSVTAVIVFSRAIVIEASLSFLGVGTQPPAANWGVMIAEARDVITISPRLWLLPGIGLALTVLAANISAEVLGRQNGAR